MDNGCKRSPLLLVRVPLQGWSNNKHAPLASAEDLSRHNSPCVRGRDPPQGYHPARAVISSHLGADVGGEAGDGVMLLPPQHATREPPDTCAATAPDPCVSPETLETPYQPLCPQPVDRLNLVYLTFILHGIGTLMPWNMFITAKDYFVEHKMSQQYTGKESDYATNFLAYIGFAAQVPSLIFNWLNIFMQIGGNLTTRIVWSIFIEVVVFIFTVVLAMVDSSSWPGIFFWATMGSVVILNMANGIYQNTVYGMAAKLPFKYTGAVVLGSNVSGTLTAIISIVSLTVAPNARTAAIYYFIAALFILLACFDTYFALPLNRFYRYHELLNQKELQSKRKANLGQLPHTPYFTVFKKCLPQLFNVFFVFFVTLAIFPALHSDIKRSNDDFFITSLYFTEVTCFLTFNVCAMIGSTLSAWIQWPGPKYLVVPVVLRVFFIPFFIVCNYQPANVERVFPIFIDNDWVYWVAAMLLGLTSGHFSSLAMMYCPRMVEPQHVVTAGMFGAASLITGICAGIVFTMALPWFVTTVAWTV